MAIDIKATFEKNDGEHLEFDRIKNKRSKRPDLHAFLLLDELAPGNGDMVVAAEHDQIWIDTKIDDLEHSGITEEQVVELIRCGVFYDDDCDCLAMFV